METFQYGDVYVELILPLFLVCLHGNVFVLKWKRLRCYFGAIKMATSNSVATMDQTVNGKQRIVMVKGRESDQKQMDTED